MPGSNIICNGSCISYRWNDRPHSIGKSQESILPPLWDQAVIEICCPETREAWLDLRMSTIGASEAPAMLGVHPYTTPYQLWAQKSGLVQFEDNKQTRRGRLIEPVAIEILREERPRWSVIQNVIGKDGTFYQDLDAGLSCTPDAFVDKDDFSGDGICQIKTVNPHAFQSDWMIDGEIQLPVYVAIQTMQEIYLTGASWGCVAAIVGFDLDFHIIDVEIHAGVIARIKREAPEFLRRVRENDPPPPDYARDGAAIADLYRDDDGGTIDLSSNERVMQLVSRRELAKNVEANGAEAAKQRKVIDAELIHYLGNATRGTLADGRVIEAATVRRAGYTVEPTIYRAVKIKTPKRKVA
jgi:predicted phage-related endonuclease